MTASTKASLEEQISQVIKVACREKDWEVAEFLLQALEAIADRENNHDPVEAAYIEILESFPGKSLH